MLDSQLQRRRKLYSNLSSQIAQIDNARLHSLFDESQPFNSWGRSQVIALGQSKVFVKRVPVTDVEYDNMFSTRNLYDLPTYYNYGFGSVGLGVFRELVTHIKTTNWVLEGAIATLPLMYHYRIIPFAGVRAQVDLDRHARYVEYWGGSSNLDKYIFDRANANYELVLFLEHFPHTVATWLLDNPGKMPFVLADMLDTVTFLGKNGILHLDSHLFNVLTDSKHVYLADFGLALDKHFDLTPAEKEFFKHHRDYDFGYLLWNLGSHLSDQYERLPETDKNLISQKYGIQAGAEVDQSILLNNLDDIISSGLMKLDRHYTASLAKYWKVSAFMHDFYLTMRKNNKKDNRFDHVTLRRLLNETGFLPESASNR